MKLLRLTSLLATASAFAPTELVTAAPRAVRAPRAPVVSASVASLTRRSALAAALSLLAATPPRAAFASQDPNDLNRFKKGLEGVNYLLDNWEKETQECTSKGDGICTDTPDRVRFYMGLKTTDHPLFQLDKLYAKAQDKLPDDANFEEWIEATEGLASQIAKINELAYTCVPLPPFPLQRALLSDTPAGIAHTGRLLASTTRAAARRWFASTSSSARSRSSSPKAHWKRS